MQFDPHDRIIHILLDEELGGQAPPDLAQKVLARAFPARKTPRHMLIGAAAAVALAVLGWAVLKGGYPAGSQPAGSYPEPQASGSFEIAGGLELARGATLIAAGPAELRLGGYCRMAISAGSRLTIQGRNAAEAVFLHGGSLACEIDRSSGAFEVHTDAGTVSVTGTEFVVEILESKGDSKMQPGMLVKVLVGTVIVAGAWGEVSLVAGEEKVLPENRIITGILVEKGERTIEVKADGDKAARLYYYGDRMAAIVKKLIGSNRVKLAWRPDGNKRALVAIEMLVPEEKEGRFVGVVTAKGKYWVDVKPGDEEPSERYMPEWVRREGSDGALDKKMIEKIAQLRVGDVVRIDWKYDERKRVVELEVLERAEGDKPVEREREEARERVEPREPDAKAGTTIGVIIEKGDNAIRVKPEEGESVRFMPRWIGNAPAQGGGLDKEMLRKFAALKVGDKVRVEWILAEGKRAVAVEVLAKAEEPPAPDARAGTAVGVVTELGDLWLRVKEEDGTSQRYTPRWIGGMPADGGGLDKEMVRKIGTVRVGDKVRIEWIYEERLRVVALEILERRMTEERPREKR